jgi:peptide/nickel transport system permease protein
MSVTAVDPIDPIGVPAEAQTDSPGFLRRLVSRKLGAFCIGYLLVLVAIAIVAPIVWPHIGSEQAGQLTEVRAQPSAHHLLGTDEVGRDVLSGFSSAPG